MQDDNPTNSEKKRKLDDFFADVQTKLQELHSGSITNQSKLDQLRKRFQANNELINTKRLKKDPVLKVEAQVESEQDIAVKSFNNKLL